MCQIHLFEDNSILDHWAGSGSIHFDQGRFDFELQKLVDTILIGKIRFRVWKLSQVHFGRGRFDSEREKLVEFNLIDEISMMSRKMCQIHFDQRECDFERENELNSFSRSKSHSL
jgi:hypothetical protein